MMFSSRNFQLWLSCQFFHVFYVRSQVTGQPVTGSYLVRHSPLVTLLKLMFAVVQWPSHLWLFVTPWTAARQASLSLTISWSLPKFMSIASVMSSSHLILWCPLLLLPSIFPSIRDFSNELLFASNDQNTGALASASVIPTSIQGWFLLRLTGLISLLSRGLLGVFSSTTVQRDYHK